MGQVGIIKSDEYDYERVLSDVDKLLSELDVLKNIKQSSFLVKTNLLKKNIEILNYFKLILYIL